jgi:hypothetical protein
MFLNPDSGAIIYLPWFNLDSSGYYLPAMVSSDFIHRLLHIYLPWFKPDSGGQNIPATV